MAEQAFQRATAWAERHPARLAEEEAEHLQHSQDLVAEHGMAAARAALSLAADVVGLGTA